MSAPRHPRMTRHRNPRRASQPPSFSLQPSAFSLPSSARRSRAAFSLVEIMVVVGIIALLATILIPAISAARNSARVASTKGTLSVLDTGIATFRADQVVGGDLPPSRSDAPESAAYRTSRPYIGHGMPYFNGAHFLAWAMVGADLQGTPGFRDLNGNGAWFDDVGRSGGLYTMGDDNKPIFARSGPYVEAEKVNMPAYRYDPSVGDPYPVFPIDGQPLLTPEHMNSVVFLDAWNQPILYYKANPAHGNMAGLGSKQPQEPQAGIYELADNAIFTGPMAILPNPQNRPAQPADFGAGTGHFEKNTPGDKFAGFQQTIHNPNVPSGIVKPHRADSYILLSAGPDGLYGTADDIANFDVNK